MNRWAASDPWGLQRELPTPEECKQAAMLCVSLTARGNRVNKLQQWANVNNTDMAHKTPTEKKKPEIYFPCTHNGSRIVVLKVTFHL
jgi:hypothetical protein